MDMDEYPNIQDHHQLRSNGYDDRGGLQHQYDRLQVNGKGHLFAPEMKGDNYEEEEEDKFIGEYVAMVENNGRL